MSTTRLVQYVFAQRIDRGGPGMTPDWPQADHALNRFYLVADVDAILRQREEELARLKAKAAERRENCIDYYEEQLTDLRAQLAAMTAERDKLVKCAYMGPLRNCPTHGESEQLKELTQQLTASQARCTQLEKAWADARDSILNERHQLEGYEIDGDFINAVLGVLDDEYPHPLTERPPA